MKRRVHLEVITSAATEADPEGESEIAPEGNAMTSISKVGRKNLMMTEDTSAPLTPKGADGKSTMKSSLEEGMLKVVHAAELKKRGVRFLPAQVVKRSLRKLKNSIRVEDPPELCFLVNKHQA